MGVKISQLPLILTPQLTDVFPIVQAGVTSQENMSQLATLLFNSPTIKTPIIDSIKDTNGFTALVLTPGAGTPVNYVAIQNAATGLNPAIGAGGTDTNIGMNFTAKGTGLIALESASTTTPIVIYSGTTLQHQTYFAMANTNASRTVTFPDFDGTFYLSSKANGTEAANAVTASGTSGIITTSALTTAADASYAITWTNTFIATASIIILSLMGGTNTKNTLQIKATAGVGTSTLTITNNNAGALDGTVLIGYIVIP